MGPVRALADGVFKTGQVWGRSGWSEFWWFAPFAAVPPVVVALRRDWLVSGAESLTSIGWVGLAALPLLSAASRRLQDAGEEGLQAFYPILGLFMIWLGWHSIGSVVSLFPPVGLLLLLSLFMLPFVWICLGLLPPLAALMVTAQVLGLLLLPGDPGPNCYGPDPREAYA